MRVDALDAPLRFESAAECVRFERESFGAFHAMLAGVGRADCEKAWREIETELRPFETSEWIRRPVPASDRNRTPRLLIFRHFGR